MKNNRLIIKLCVLLMLFMAVLQPFSSLEVNAAKGDIEYMKDIMKHKYSYPTTDRDKANDFIFSFYRIAEYHVYADLDKATDEQIMRGLQYGANNAVALYDEAVNNPANRRRYEKEQILIAVDLMKRMTSVGIENTPYSQFLMRGRDVFLQAFTDAGIVAEDPSVIAKANALKAYPGNTSEFNAYNYYSRYPDLQAGLGANGDALFKHYNEFGKAEGRDAR